jgi:4-hydroxy-2-oxoheptanedioate aldolase
MNAGELLLALHEGRQVFGTLIVSPSPRWPQVVRACGLDFVFLDTEHIALDRHQLSWMCHTYAALGLAPLVRIASPDPYLATMALDGGAAGVVAPYIESADQVRALRGAVKLRPVKGRKLAQILGGSHPHPELGAYLDGAARESLLIVNIESVPALEALDDILAVPGLDAVLIGPHDLTCNLDIPEKYADEKFREAVRLILRKARAAGCGAGIHFSNGLSLAHEFIREGANFFIHSSDIQLFAESLKRDIQQLATLAANPQPTAVTIGAPTVAARELVV